MINKQKSTRLKHFHYSQAFVEYSNDIDDICKKTEEYSPNKNVKYYFFFDDKIADKFCNKKNSPIVTESFIFLAVEN